MTAGPESGKRRIAVLGGGMGALSAVFELTSDRDWQDKFEITVYQLGWRLGGKGASGRSTQPHRRSEEHGLHIWLGFYHNALHMMQRCYAEMDPRCNHGIRSLHQAFRQLDRVTLLERFGGGHVPTDYRRSVNTTQPGSDPRQSGTPWDWFKRLLRATVGGVGPLEFPDLQGPLDDSDRSPTPWEAAADFADGLDDDPARHSAEERNHLQELLEQGQMRMQDLPPVEMFDDPDLFKAYLLMNLGLALARGLIADGVIYHGFEKIEGLEWSEWMHLHGASPEALGSAPVRACYDLVFGYRDGDPAQRDVGAGTGTRCLLRMLFDYRGALFYEVRAGLGETVFTPLYLVLRQRGVAFRFFQRVRQLHPSPDRQAIDAITIETQAEPRGSYEPLERVGKPLCWPSAPRYAALRQGKELRSSRADLESYWTDWRGKDRVLRRGADFDDVLLGIPLGALSEICADLPAPGNGWADMLTKVPTVATMAAQLWTSRTADELNGGDCSPLLGACDKPLDTVYDATQILRAEDWRGEARPQGLFYLCSALPDVETPAAPAPAFPAAERERVCELTARWLTDSTAPVWPGAFVGDDFDWATLHGGALEAQYLRANVNPWDRYVQSWAGTARYRLKADASGYDNLYLAGDWTRTGLNAGCMEAAAMSGLRAARAISGRDIFIGGEDDAFGPRGRRGRVGLPRPSPPGLDEVVGEISAAATTLLLPEAAVRRMLPRGLVPAESDLGGPGLCPVGLLFARLHAARPAALPARLGFTYREATVAVPFTRLAGDRGGGQRYTLLPALYLDRALPTLLGRAFYGFAKHPARIAADGGRYEVRSPLLGRTLFSLRQSPAGATGGLADFPHLKAARRMFERPLIIAGCPFGWRFASMDFGFARARFTPIEGRLRIGRRTVPGLEGGSHPLASILSSPLGAFRFEAEWRLRPLRPPPAG